MTKVFGSTAIAAIIAPLLAAPSFAQTLTWWDILSPDRVIGTFTRYGVILARTQVDLTFEDISTNLRSNRTTISNLRMWPVPPWQIQGLCQVSMERVTINGQAFDNLDDVTVRLDAYETAIAPGCLPPPLVAGLERLNVDELSLPSISLNVSYHIPSSRATVSMLASATDFAEATVEAEFDYVSMRTPAGRGDPYPIAALSKASIALHNLGGWEAVSDDLPPAFTQDASAEAAVENLLRAALTEMNRESFDLQSDDLTVLQLALVSSVATAWTEFLQSPDQLVLETNIAPDRPVFLNIPAYEHNPAWIVRDLNPVMRASASPVARPVPRDAIDAVMSGAARDVPTDERLRIGLALARGEGVPRNVALATDLLTEFAEGGNEEAATALADALEDTDPEASYIWSLRAGALGSSGAASRLDRLEGELSLPDILRLQDQAAGDAGEETALPTSIVGIRARARGHLTGIGARRDYGAALTWASVGAALDDAASAALGDEVAKTLDAAQDATAKAAVTALRRQSNGDALALWARVTPVLGSARPSAEDAAAAPAETDEAADVDDEQLQTCQRVLTEKVSKTYEVGGSCKANNVALLRELALALRQQDELRTQAALREDPDPPSAPVEPEVAAPLAEESSNAAAPESERGLDTVDVRPAARAADEAILIAENELLRQELANATEELAAGDARATLMNEQVAALRAELASLQLVLDAASERDQTAQLQMENLGAQLNVALARVAAEQKRLAEMEAAEAERRAQEAARTPSDADLLVQVRGEVLADLQRALGDRSDVTVTGDRVVFASGALFGPGPTALSAGGQAQIAEVVDRLTAASEGLPPSVDWIIRIDGHTDDIPISGGSFADNWELSQARALSVVRFLTDERAVPPHRLAAVGFGEFRPVNPDSTAEARAQNRRIELLLTTR